MNSKKNNMKRLEKKYKNARNKIILEHKLLPFLK